MYQNRVSIIGFVGHDAQLRSTNKGAPVAVFSVATKSSWKNASGGYDSRREWHRCVASVQDGEAMGPTALAAWGLGHSRPFGPTSVRTQFLRYCDR
jgi:hypothetical protein